MLQVVWHSESFPEVDLLSCVMDAGPEASRERRMLLDHGQPNAGRRQALRALPSCSGRDQGVPCKDQHLCGAGPAIPRCERAYLWRQHFLAQAPGLYPAICLQRPSDPAWYMRRPFLLVKVCVRVLRSKPCRIWNGPLSDRLSMLMRALGQPAIRCHWDSMSGLTCIFQQLYRNILPMCTYRQARA